MDFKSLLTRVLHQELLIVGEIEAPPPAYLFVKVDLFECHSYLASLLKPHEEDVASIIYDASKAITTVQQ